MAHVYSHLYGLPTTGLRFFTVYGPWGRPDMAPFLFTKAILEGTPIKLFNHGNLKRDFTFIDDIMDGVVAIMEKVPAREVSESALVQTAVGRPTASIILAITSPSLCCILSNSLSANGSQGDLYGMPMQPGDVPITYADVSELEEMTGFSPHTSIEDGLREFVAWYRQSYCVWWLSNVLVFMGINITGSLIQLPSLGGGHTTGYDRRLGACFRCPSRTRRQLRDSALAGRSRQRCLARIAASPQGTVFLAKTR